VETVSGVGSVFSGEVVVGGAVGAGWWLVDEGDGPGRVVAGPFADRAEAGWAAAGGADAGGAATGAAAGGAGQVRAVYGIGRADGGLTRRPSPQDWAWLGHLGEQLDRLGAEWDALLTDEDALGTLVVEVTAALAEAGLGLHAEGGAVGGAVLVPEPELGGIVVSWRQHDRMSLDQLHGAAADAVVQQVMNRALAEVLAARGFDVTPFGGASSHVVRRGA
jgi:hypothetical protein